MPEQKHPWELPGWAARIEATGWPEWEQGKARARYRLGHSGDTTWTRRDSDGNFSYLTDHEAACLIDNFLTAWLRERDVLLHPSLHRGDFLVKRWSPTGQGGWLLGEGGWHDTGDEAKSARFATEREAVAAAVDAVLKEQE